ncbi:MAG: NAD-dependent epimerase/dehydratase family protein [Cruoricaptor ignavus]|nr:NAD-dependent epimerase/dehydratase family protein [Cruoricaptor ignavus]
MKNKIALFGATGFLGSYLEANLSGILVPVNIRKTDWESGIADSQVFINCIGKAHDHAGNATKEDFYFANFHIVKKLFDVFLKSKATLFIHISSIASTEEYNRDKSIEEKDEPNPQSFYGKSKYEAEKWLMEQSLPENKRVIILRPPMIHGVGDKGSLVLLHKIISKGIPYPLASFNNYRSFISLENVLFFIEEIIEKHNHIKSGIYNISDDESISTKKIIEIIKEIENKNIISLNIPKSVIIILAKIGDFVPIPLNTKRLKKMTGNLEVSNKKIKSTLGITRLPLTAEEGIRKTIKSFKNK